MEVSVVSSEQSSITFGIRVKHEKNESSAAVTLFALLGAYLQPRGTVSNLR